MSRACRKNGGKRNAYRILVGKPEAKESLKSPRRRWGIILKWILGWSGMN
jgi:hypothetical protein